MDDDHDHRYDDLSKPISQQGYVTAPVKIGNNVWLGAKVTDLKGVTIGDGVIVGANSVVTKDLPANSICAGILSEGDQNAVMTIYTQAYRLSNINLTLPLARVIF